MYYQFMGVGPCSDNGDQINFFYNTEGDIDTCRRHCTKIENECIGYGFESAQTMCFYIYNIISRKKLLSHRQILLLILVI
eukprot:UN10076